MGQVDIVEIEFFIFPHSVYELRVNDLTTFSVPHFQSQNGRMSNFFNALSRGIKLKVFTLENFSNTVKFLLQL